MTIVHAFMLHEVYKKVLILELTCQQINIWQKAEIY